MTERGRVERSDETQGGLKGVHVLLTRRPEQSAGLVSAITERGGTVSVLSVIDIAGPDSWSACDDALKSLSRYNAVVFTSANAVSRFFGRAEQLKVPVDAFRALRVFAVGKATADLLVETGISVETLPAGFSSEMLAESILTGSVAGMRFLLPQGNIAMTTLGSALEDAGAKVDRVVVYRTVEVDPDLIREEAARIGMEAVDVVTFASPSAVRSFFKALPIGDPRAGKRRPALAAIGPTTAAAMGRLGLEADIIAGESTGIGLVHSIEEFFRKGKVS